MSTEPGKTKPREDGPQPSDGRGPRPTDPNELAKWLIDQATASDQDPSSTDLNNGTGKV